MMTGKIYSVVYVLLLVVILIHSCGKNKDTSPPVISIYYPADTTVIHSGDTVHVEGMVTDDAGLHELFVSIEDITAGTFAFYNHPYVHNSKTFHFKYQWVTSGSSVHRLTVEAIDHKLHNSKKELILPVN